MSDLKIQELERRIKVLESQNEQPKFNYYKCTKESLNSSTEHEMRFEFNAKTKCYLQLESYVSSSMVGFHIKIYLNGNQIYNNYSLGKTITISSVVPVASGKNEVVINFSSTTFFTISECTLRTFGNLFYPDGENYLTSINESERSVILHLASESLTISTFESSLKEVLKFEGVNGGTICKIGDYYLVVIAYKSGSATAYKYDQSFSLIGSAELDEEINSVCSISANPAKVFAVRGNRVYLYEIYQDLSMVVTVTEHRAKKVRANPSVKEYIIIVDHSDNGKLIKI